MRVALTLARRGLGAVWPNPSVGCVIVNQGRVVGRGWTQPGGRPHAESEALGRAGALAKGALNRTRAGKVIEFVWRLESVKAIGALMPLLKISSTPKAKG